jgi:arylsulfatase A-like enzyme
LADVKAPPQFQGKSLSGSLSGQPLRQEIPHIISEYHDSRAVRTQDWKLIQRGNGIGDPPPTSLEATELYNLTSDAAEEVNLATVRRDCTDQLATVLQLFAAGIDSSIQVPDTFTKDDLTLERLRGLGYVE